MGRAKNSLTRESVSSTPVKFRYAATYESSSLLDYGITVNLGTNYPYIVGMSEGDMEQMNVYRMIKHLYYNVAITGSRGTSSFFDPMWQSTAASSSGVETVYKFPTATSSSILVLCVPSTQFGENFGRKTFVLSSSTYYIQDDGNGNLRDYKNSAAHVGNIFYAQGIAVITDETYVLPQEEDCNILNTEDYYDIQTQNYYDICIPTASINIECDLLNTQDFNLVQTQNFDNICVTGSFDDCNIMNSQLYYDIQTQNDYDICLPPDPL